MIWIKRSAVGALCIFASIAGAAAAHATDAADFNVLVFTDFTSQYTDVEGALAAGRDIKIQGFTVGDNLPSSAGVNTLIAGRSLTYNSGELRHGDASSPTISGSFTINNGQLANDSTLNFTNLKTYYTNLSSNYAGDAATGIVSTNGYGTYTLTGTSVGINVFDLTAAELGNLNTFNLDISNDGYAVINVSGTSITLPNIGYSASVAASHILFNFSEATSINVSSFLGSILAPDAAVTAGYGAINGQLIANSYSGNDQINYDLAAGPLSLAAPTPEASTWLMLITGVGAIGATLRRRGLTAPKALAA